ncbi:MAG: hypothetical protein Ct9H90mP16_11680 [Candidatus Poseidoniales archaeon]|nr:MAG: hypothetical protein Ct9H90mP16_11680 [Candidatus Poseidoniales archaeon]
MNALAVRGGIAYLGTNNRGIERIDLVNSTRLSPWTSTGLDDLESMPIAIDGDTLYLGVYDYGVIVYNATTVSKPTCGNVRVEIDPEAIKFPSNEVLSLAVISPGTILVGTADGGAQRTSNGWTEMGSTGNEFADEFYDWDFDNQYIYAAPKPVFANGRVLTWHSRSVGTTIQMAFLLSLHIRLNSLNPVEFGSGITRVQASLTSPTTL